jgi:hypothetical protein
LKDSTGWKRYGQIEAQQGLEEVGQIEAQQGLEEHRVFAGGN